MKVFFDTNVYVAQALLGRNADRIISATIEARWKIFVSEYVLSEISRVLLERVE